MRYSPPGFCLNDFEIYKKGKDYHLVHLQGPLIFPFDAARLETSYGHATSQDLIEWKTQAPVFGISRFPHFDDSAIWTMSITEYENKLWMFYTGLTQEPRFLQQVGLAIDDSLECTNWKRYSEIPVVSATGKYYQTSDFMAWRDPFVLFDDYTKQWIMYICAKTASGDTDKRGCIGCAVSENLIDWMVKEPVLSPGMYHEMECPVVFRHDDWWYMLVSIGDDRIIHTWRAEQALGPFSYMGPLAPVYNYAPRVCLAPNGNLVVLHTVPQKWQAQDSGEYMRGKLAQPKTLVFDHNGYPRLGWYSPVADFYTAVNTGDRVNNFLMSITLPSEGSSLTAKIRSQDNQANRGVELVYDKKRLILRYIEDRSELAVKIYHQKLNTIKILTHEEYYEIYLDGILEMTALGYRYLDGYCNLTINGITGDFTLYRCNYE
jgi:sucrose-6-phosphate hydrolase SacC (GH32 family)